MVEGVGKVNFSIGGSYYGKQKVGIGKGWVIVIDFCDGVDRKVVVQWVFGVYNFLYVFFIGIGMNIFTVFLDY